MGYGLCKPVVGSSLKHESGKYSELKSAFSEY